jgi:ABC-type transport system involved in multi-copper enzyme maturation permease subunit
MSTIYLLTLRQLAGKWRLIIMTVLATMPVVMAALMLRSRTAPSVQEFETQILSAMLAGSIAPLVVLAIAAAAFGNEVEDRTLANLTLAPIPRWRIALPKLLATLTVAGPFIAASAFATSWIAFLGDVQASMAVTLSALAGVALYAAFFVWLGLVSTQAIGIGLLYIVLWEGFFAGFVQGVRLLSIRHHAIALMHGLDERRFAFGSHLDPTLASMIAAAVFGGFVWLTVRRLQTMDVP